jgi:hypothetical protein
MSSANGNTTDGCVRLSLLPAACEADSTGTVAWVRLDRPRRGNALTPSMCQQLVDVLDKVSKDVSKRIRVLILTGTGKYFCTGGSQRTSKTKCKHLHTMYLYIYDFVASITFSLHVLTCFRLGMDLKQASNEDSDLSRGEQDQVCSPSIRSKH